MTHYQHICCIIWSKNDLINDYCWSWHFLGQYIVQNILRLVVIPHKPYLSKIFGNSATKEGWQSKHLHLFSVSYLLLPVIMFSEMSLIFKRLLIPFLCCQSSDITNTMKSVIAANYRRGTVHSAWFPSVLYPETESFPPEQLSSHCSKKKQKKKNVDETCGYWAIPRSLENMFVSFGAHVFCGKSRAGDNEK